VKSEGRQRYDHFYGPSLQVEFPTGSAKMMTLGAVAFELSRRLTHLFLTDRTGAQDPSSVTSRAKSNSKSEIRNLKSEEPVLFHEYFHAETGQGLGASHQTGWTALIVRCLEDLATRRKKQ
jgi:hypothetical protein